MKKKLDLLKKYLVYFLLLIIIILVGVVTVLLLENNTSTSSTLISTETSAPNLIETIQITPDPTETATLPEPTATTIVVPEKNDFFDGIWLVSLFNGKNYSIYAFHPNYLQPVRLFENTYDEVEPSLSPDGSWLLYRSNQDGFWDIYIRNIATNETVNVTESDQFDGSPAWSPDGQWIVYETYNGENFEINIQQITNLESDPIQLTTDSADNHSPSWSSKGREIAFVSDRSGNNDIWIARFDYLEDERFINITNSPDYQETHPSYSTSGSRLLYVRDHGAEKQIAIIDYSQNLMEVFDFGISAFWKYDDSAIISQIEFPNGFAASVYSTTTKFQTEPLVTLQSELIGAQWISPVNSLILQKYLCDQSSQADQSAETIQSTADNSSREKIVKLDSVVAPYPYIAESVEQPFNGLRGVIGQATGWDYLANLESAYTPITDPPDLGLPQNWIYTGRAIALNTLPMQAEWMAIQRDNISGQIFWRIWIKALKQDGSMGVPIKDAIWRLDARFSGSTMAYENGGAYAAPPDGYWVDVTSLALENKWYRLPALSSWRTYYSAARYNIFVYESIDDWTLSMLRIYPPEALATSTPAISSAGESGSQVKTMTPTATKKP